MEKKTTDVLLQSGLTAFFGSIALSFLLGMSPENAGKILFLPILIVAWIFFSRKKD
ncbi:MAG: hypothetical protein WC488_02930 [Candidatus Micrarchaeia archaeon]